MTQLITDEYKALNVQMHRDKPGYGMVGWRYEADIVNTLESVGARTVLDYGAGKCSLANALTSRADGDRWVVRNYDPCVPIIAAPPEPADVVTCTDVLEHVEPECLDAVLSHIYELAERAAFFAVHIGPANKHLADGRNAHLIQQPHEWWMAKLMEYWPAGGFDKLQHELITYMIPKRKWRDLKKANGDANATAASQPVETTAVAEGEV